MPKCAGDNFAIKDFAQGSPGSPLISIGNPSFSVVSPDSDFFDLILDGTVDTSIDQMYLYQNVCEMQSSDQSPSRCSSFISYGQESRIDSELQFLAGGGMIRKANQNEESEVVNPGARSKCIRRRPQNMSPGKEKMVSPARAKCRQGDRDYLGPYLLKQARDAIVSGNNTHKALELAIRALKSFEAYVGDKSSLRLVMCLHVVAALYCRLGDYAKAIPILERSINIPVMDLGSNHALAKFAGCMQLGDTLASLGLIEKSLELYVAGLEIQLRVLGENDQRYGDTCRYLAEAYVQAFQFDEAERLCTIALEIHKNGMKEAEDRRLMGLIYDAKGDYEGALVHYLLARTAMVGNTGNADLAAVDCSIGDAYMSLGRYEEAVVVYRKAIKLVKSVDQLSTAFGLIRLANLCCKMGNLAEAKTYCNNALKIYGKQNPGMCAADDVVDGLVEMSAVYVCMGELDQAIWMLEKVVNVYGDAPGRRLSMVVGIEAQIGVLHYIKGRYGESYGCMKKSIEKLRAVGETKTTLYGIALNQMGLACLRLMLVDEAKDLFEEARSVLEGECGTYHADTLGVYGNLSGTYDAMGRTADAIEMLEYVVVMREKRLGKGKAGLEDEKHRLAMLLKESGQ